MRAAVAPARRLRAWPSRGASPPARGMKHAAGAGTVARMPRAVFGRFHESTIIHRFATLTLPRQACSLSALSFRHDGNPGFMQPPTR